jgi:hypothetical protein
MAPFWHRLRAPAAKAGKLSDIPTGIPMAKPNYAFAKRQRELAKKAKKEAKQREKQAANAPDTPESPDTPVTDAPRPVEPNT